MKHHICIYFFLFVTVFIYHTSCQFDNGFGQIDNGGGAVVGGGAGGGGQEFNQPKENNGLNSFLSSQENELSGLLGNNHESSSISPSTDEANSDLLKQVNNQDGRMGNFMQEGNDDQSVRELLKSFQMDDTKGNYLHHGEHGDYGEASNSFSEDRIKNAVDNNPDVRDSGSFQGGSSYGQSPSFNSPVYLVTKEVELEISSGGSVMGDILIGLFGNTVPKTVANFADLADSTRGFGYRGSRFHRVIKDFMIQGGDITNGDGTGGRSIYGAQFPDENFSVQMKGAGWACMANAGKDTNDSQFFITTADTPWLNGHHVCFGKVLKGMATVYAVQDVPKSDDKPNQDVIISACRSHPVQNPFEVSQGPATQ